MLLLAQQNRSDAWRYVLLAAGGLFLLGALFLQIFAQRHSSVPISEIADGTISAQIRAEAHWNSLLLGNREAFLSGFTNEALLVVVPFDDDVLNDTLDEAPPQVSLEGMEAIVASWEVELAPLQVADAPLRTIEIVHTQINERRADADLYVRSIAEDDDNVLLLHVRAAARVNERGQIFEERLETVTRADPVFR